MPIICLEVASGVVKSTTRAAVVLWCVDLSSFDYE
jgi:hypothetical protein